MNTNILEYKSKFTEPVFSLYSTCTILLYDYSQSATMSEEAMDTTSSVGHSLDGEVNAEAIHDDRKKHVAPAEGARVQYKTNSEKLARARELKDIGNTLFKSGDTKSAVKKYHHALMFVKGLTSPDLELSGLSNDLIGEKVTKEEREMGNELSALIHNNIAGSYY